MATGILLPLTYLLIPTQHFIICLIISSIFFGRTRWLPFHSINHHNLGRCHLAFIGSGFSAKDPVPVDAIPDIGGTSRSFFTTWPGRSPQDIERSISYPMTTYLLGIPGGKDESVVLRYRFSSIYIIFNDDVDYLLVRVPGFWKILNSLPSGPLTEEACGRPWGPMHCFGQVYWYTLEEGQG